MNALPAFDLIDMVLDAGGTLDVIDGRLIVDVPQPLSAHVWHSLAARKSIIVANLTNGGPTWREGSAAHHMERQSQPVHPPCSRCRCPEMREVPIHGGESARADCVQCGKTCCFAMWYGIRTPCGRHTPARHSC